MFSNLDRRARIFWPGACHGHGSLRVGVGRQADEELAAGEQDVWSGQQSFRWSRLENNLKRNLYLISFIHSLEISSKLTNT